MYHGMPQLGDVFRLLFVVEDEDGIPINADSYPSFRIYGPSGFITGQSGFVSFADTKNVTAATNASPIVITSANHGLTTGTLVTITGVGGNTAANGTFVITRIDANTFSLNGSSGNGSYTSGGVWNITGLYRVTLTLTNTNGYDSGKNYAALFTGKRNGDDFVQLHTFTVT